MSKKKQTVVKVDINCEKCQKEIFSKVGRIKGIQSVVVDETKKTVTVVGNVEPVPIFKALKKIKKNPEIVTVGPPKRKCPYCPYFQCSCGHGGGGGSSYTSLPPLPPVYDPYWRQPPLQSSYYWPDPGWQTQQPPPYYWPPKQCELVGVAYPPPSSFDGPGQCTIL